MKRALMFAAVLALAAAPALAEEGRVPNSTLKSLGDKMSDDLLKIFDDLAKEDAVLKALQDSEPKKLAVQQMKEITDDLQNGLKELKTALREQEELLRT